MKLQSVKPGTFFEFTSSDWNLGRCLWIGTSVEKEDTEVCVFAHKTSKKLMTSRWFYTDDIDVTIDTPQRWSE